MESFIIMPCLLYWVACNGLLVVGTYIVFVNATQIIEEEKPFLKRVVVVFPI